MTDKNIIVSRSLAATVLVGVLALYWAFAAIVG